MAEVVLLYNGRQEKKFQMLSSGRYSTPLLGLIIEPKLRRVRKNTERPAQSIQHSMVTIAVILVTYDIRPPGSSLVRLRPAREGRHTIEPRCGRRGMYGVLYVLKEKSIDSTGLSPCG